MSKRRGGCEKSAPAVPLRATLRARGSVVVEAAVVERPAFARALVGGARTVLRELARKNRP